MWYSGSMGAGYWGKRGAVSTMKPCRTCKHAHHSAVICREMFKCSIDHSAWEPNLSVKVEALINILKAIDEHLEKELIPNVPYLKKLVRQGLKHEHR